MSDTPDTDALDHELHSPCVLQDRYSEMRDHARRLERERDEWYYKAHANAAFTLEARRERDEEREQNASLRCIAERAIHYLDQSYRDGFSNKASELRYKLKQLKEGAK